MTKHLNFHLQGIEILAFSFTEYNIAADVDSIRFDIEQEQKARQEKSLIINIVSIQLLNIKSSAKLAHLKIACGFEVPSFDKAVKQGKQGEAIIDHHLNASLNRISIATARGILFSQLKGTTLHHAIMPILALESNPTP
ncbi:hypothetical protein [Chitinophaga sp. sic0106]|uniref:hypothetical protein n=1 Tax=Chitinophaga sp. sic0106 TaxID=2854785 RepID=UPI001C4760C6|nr:hypothetical protein [Chitinophaga sp. sic0106]MBV7530667.1 hypothetical protein [Chitinophaga sp. sic0106]